ncbi:MAG TPA: hypothetical protein VF884_12575 [Nitrososphaeraceae archaeon]
MSAPEGCVMIVNDNTDLLNLFKTALEGEKIKIYAFTDPTLALKKIRSNPNLISLVLIDYSSQIRKSQRKFAHEAKAINRQIKVVLTSGYNLSPEDVLKDGYDKFLQLPVRLADLVFTIRELLDLN